MKDNFNALNIGMLLLGILLILAAVYNRKVGDLIRGIGSGDLSVFSPDAKVGDTTAGSSGQTGFNGGGGFSGGGGGSW